MRVKSTLADFHHLRGSCKIDFFFGFDSSSSYIAVLMNMSSDKSNIVCIDEENESSSSSSSDKDVFGGINDPEF